MAQPRGSRSFTVCVVSLAERWQALAGEVRRAPSPWSCPAVGELYLLALADAPRVLGGFRQLDPERVRDLASDTFCHKLHALLEADTPRGLFATALQRDALSWLRSPRSRVAEAPSDDASPAREAPAHGREESRAIARIDGVRALAALSSREREVLLADAEGVPREALALCHRTSRANIDQLVSRARRRFAAATGRGRVGA
ncbi:MAG: hypothetical protein HY909_09675 [Deltaproteobacteria bacterium]|nr:hypothetical protein [Deltaproteobacteria bacterium]